ncbi:unnamed protein product, partial [Rotaria magnacalcarata]
MQFISAYFVLVHLDFFNSKFNSIQSKWTQ